MSQSKAVYKEFITAFSRAKFKGFEYDFLRIPGALFVPVRGFQRERGFVCKDPKFDDKFPERRRKEGNP